MTHRIFFLADFMRDLFKGRGERPPLRTLREQLVWDFSLPVSISAPTRRDSIYRYKNFEKVLDTVRAVTERQPAWAGVDRRLIAQAIHHFDVHQGIALAKDNPEVLIAATSGRDESGYQRVLRFRAVEGRISVDLRMEGLAFSDRVRVVSPNMGDVLQRLFEADPSLAVREAKGVTEAAYYEGVPMVRHSKVISMEIKHEKDLLAMAQVVAFQKVFRSAVDRAAERAVQRISVFDSTGTIPPFEYEGEYFVDVVEKAVVDAAKEALSANPEMAGRLKGVNAEVSDRAITPTFTVGVTKSFFGQPITEYEEVRGKPIPLSERLPLSIQRLQFPVWERDLQGYRTVDVPLLPGEEISVAFYMYSGAYKPKALHEWIRQNFKHTIGAERKRSVNPVSEALQLLDINEKEFAKTSDEDKHASIRRRATTLLSQFHPDRFEGNAEELELATEMTRELLEARKLLFSKYPKPSGSGVGGAPAQQSPTSSEYAEAVRKNPFELE